MWPWPKKAVALSQVAAAPGAAPLANTAANGVWIDVMTNGVTAIDRQTSEMLNEYTRSIYLWRCIDLIASQHGSIPLYIATGKDRQLTKEELQVQQLLAQPNPQWTGEALGYFVAASLAVANRAYLKRVRGVGGVTLELWPVPADKITNKYAKGTDILIAYEIQNGTTKETFPVAPDGDSDIIFISRAALSAKGDKSPAAVAAPPAEVFSRILQRCADIVNNTSNITGLLSTKAEVGENAVQKVKERLMQFRLGGGDSGGTIVTANAEWQLTRLSDDPSAALSVETKDSLARDVAMTFGVPTQLLGLKGNDTYNNMREARVSFITETVLPGYTNIIVAALTAMLCRGMPVTIEPDLDQLPAMVQARLALVDIASQATMLTINEQREMMGFGRFEDPLADVPIQLETMKLERAKLEAMAGLPADMLQDEPT